MEPNHLAIYKRVRRFELGATVVVVFYTSKRDKNNNNIGNVSMFFTPFLGNVSTCLYSFPTV